MSCAVLGYSRQQYYKQRKELSTREQFQEQIRLLVCGERKLLPKVGTRKLQILLHSAFDERRIKCGRDQLFSVLRHYGLLNRPRKRYIQTTMSRHWMRKYPNLVRDSTPTAPEQVWVSDITYIKTDEGYSYLSLITDAYSRKIMGYNLSASLDAEQTRNALSMALAQRTYPHHTLIHHSDRGYQYCSKEYVALATKHDIRMSMTEHSDPYENALAERMNRTLKEEFLPNAPLPSRHYAQMLIRQAVELYNTYRPHLALNGRTPDQIHNKTPVTNGNRGF
jgi:putative transposase